MLNCTVIDEETINCSGKVYVLPEERLTYEDKEFWVYFAIYCGLVLAAGLMSGLTMGLLSLDLMTLKVMKDGGSAKEKKHASKILPIVQRHHLLLVTLLLGNAAAVEAMPIFLDKISDPVTAILVSVTAVLIFGEVIPQAVCTRFGLAIGAAMAPFVYVLMGLFFIVAWPLSKLLDCLLGKDHSTFYRRAQLKVLVDLHGETGGLGPAKGNDALSRDEVMIIKGALDMKNKQVKDAMVPLECVYMLDIHAKLDHETMTEITSQTHSRIPVYDGDRENIVSLLLVKTLIKLDPDDAVSVRSIVDDGIMARQVLHTTVDTPLFDLLNIFQEGKGHLAVVKQYHGHEVHFAVERQNSSLLDSPETPLLGNRNDDDDDMLLDVRSNVVGIITLEDVLEELIQEEIIDETDVYIDIKRQIQVARAKAAKKSPLPKRNQRQAVASGTHRSVSHPPVARQHKQSSHTPDLLTINDVDSGQDSSLLNNQVLI